MYVMIFINMFQRKFLELGLYVMNDFFWKLLSYLPILVEARTFYILSLWINPESENFPAHI